MALEATPAMYYAFGMDPASHSLLQGTHLLWSQQALQVKAGHEVHPTLPTSPELEVWVEERVPAQLGGAAPPHPPKRP